MIRSITEVEKASKTPDDADWLAGLDWYGRRESQIGGRFQEGERYHEMKSGDYLLIKTASIQPAWISLEHFFRNPKIHIEPNR